MSKLKIHFRRCHVCGESNECVGELVSHCSNCNKKLLPFLYFDERIEFGFSKLKNKKIKFKSKLPHNSYPPLIGMSLVWESE